MNVTTYDAWLDGTPAAGFTFYDRLNVYVSKTTGAILRADIIDHGAWFDIDADEIPADCLAVIDQYAELMEV